MRKYLKISVLVLLLILFMPTVVFADTEEQIRNTLTILLNDKFPGESVTFNSIKPSLIDENARSKVGQHLAYVAYNYKWDSNEANNIYFSVDISENENTATVTVRENSESGISVSKTLNVNWKEVDQQQSNKIKSTIQAINQLATNNFSFVDMRTVRYNTNIKDGDKSKAFHDSLFQEFMDITDLSYKKLTEGVAGSVLGNIPWSGGTNPFAIYYKGVLYNYLEKWIGADNIIYIPSDTTETKEAYIKAAKEKVNKYFPEITFSNSTKTYQRTINGITFSTEQEFNNNLNNNFDPVYLDLIIDGQRYTYVIAKGTDEQVNNNIPADIVNNTSSKRVDNEQVLTGVPNTNAFRGIVTISIGLILVIIGVTTIYYIINKKSNKENA